MIAFTRRDATDRDFDFLYRLRESSYRAHVEVLFGPWLESEQRRFLANDMTEARYEIVELDGAPIGSVAVGARDDHDLVEDLMIVPAHRGGGIGTALMRAAMGAAHARGVPLRLSVLDGNRASSLYARLGFRVTAIVPPRTKMEWP